MMAAGGPAGNTRLTSAGTATAREAPSVTLAAHPRAGASSMPGTAARRARRLSDIPQSCTAREGEIKPAHTPPVPAPEPGPSKTQTMERPRLKRAGVRPRMRPKSEVRPRFAPGCQPAAHDYIAPRRDPRRDGRVAEGARLESVYTGNRIVGSNPTPSANDLRGSLFERVTIAQLSEPFTDPSNTSERDRERLRHGCATLRSRGAVEDRAPCHQLCRSAKFSREPVSLVVEQSRQLLEANPLTRRWMIPFAVLRDGHKETPRTALISCHVFRQELIADRIEKIGPGSLVAKLEFDGFLPLGPG